MADPNAFGFLQGQAGVVLNEGFSALVPRLARTFAANNDYDI